MTDWPLIVAILGFLFGVLMAACAAAFQGGTHREKIRVLEVWKSQAEGKIEVMQQQLARGDSRFASLTEKVDDMKKTLMEIRDSIIGRRAREEDDGK